MLDFVPTGPIYEIKEIVSKSAVGEGVRYDQTVENCPKVSKRVQKAPRHEGRAVIVAYGPSLKETWHSINLERRAYGATVVSTSGAHDFLIERGIVPDIHVEVDPREHKAFFTRVPHKDVKYWIASSCHPKLVEQLLPYDLSLFHTFNSADEHRKMVENDIEKDSFMICGGGTVACRALNLMYITGFRSFSFYGMDCSFGPAGEQHAGVHSGKMQNELMTKAGDRWFRTSGTMLATAQGFIMNMTTLHRASVANNEPDIPGTHDKVEMFLHGDGLLQEMYRHQDTSCI